MWDRVDHDHPDPFVRRDIASLGFCEFRLHKGVWQCTLPFWGVRHSDQLKRITLSNEMVPWYMQADYDKPIARRLVEEAGVPRALFGQTKKNSVLPDPFAWPRSPSAQKRFQEFLRVRGIGGPGPIIVQFFRKAAILESLLHSNLLCRLGIKRRFRPWLNIKGSTAIYCWANEELRTRYTDELQKSVVVDDQAVGAGT
jgi:hypothetical protein